MPAAPDARATETPAPPRMRFVRALGEGGMGVVFLADRELGGGLTQRVVVKRPRADAGDASRALERFADEARALARVGHANVVRLLDAGADAHGPWLALEHVDGVDAHVLLESLRASTDRLTADELAWVAHEAARGMAAAHGLRDALGEPAPVLHRDLSPQNLLLSRHGEVKVADFGIAWAVDRSTRTTTGVVVGNLRYIAPEQLEGRAVGPATDVYGVGRVLEELLDVTDPAGADGLRAVAARATRRDPDERHPTMDALAEALLEAVPTLARGGAALGRRVDAIERGRARVTSALAGLLAAERADNDRVSLPAAPPAAAKETTRAPAQEAPRAVPAPTTEAPRPAPPRTLRKPALAAAAALVVAGVMAGAQRTRGGATRAGVTEAGVRPVTAVATPTPERTPEVTPEAPEVHAPPETPEQPEAPVATPTRIPGRRGQREALRTTTVAADASVAPTMPAAPAQATLRVSTLPYALVSVDDGPAVGAPHEFTVDAGEHRVRARFVNEGNVEVTRTVTVSAGEVRRIGLTP
ncbi:MAG: protein kinase [Polyangiales bacterium]